MSKEKEEIKKIIKNIPEKEKSLMQKKSKVEVFDLDEMYNKSDRKKR